MRSSASTVVMYISLPRALQHSIPHFSLGMSKADRLDLTAEPPPEPDVGIGRHSIPLDALASLLPRTVSVMELRRSTIPTVPTHVVHRPAIECFHPDAPNADALSVAILPSAAWIATACAAIRDGKVSDMVSVSDPRKSHLRYALWAPFLWQKWQEINYQKDAWDVTDHWMSIAGCRFEGVYFLIVY